MTKPHDTTTPANPDIEFLGSENSAADGNLLQRFDVANEAPELTEELTGKPAVKRLASNTGVNLIAMRFRAGQVLPHHRARYPITVQCVSGSLIFSVGDRQEELTPGTVCYLPAMVPHRVEAKQESVFLLSMHT